ncbi:homeobox protein vent1-like [Kryptolebias marmoratus]|uniref:Ventral homeobox n=1 Tax=Kryptolebias marmoratus TaxID=37003 RepID=A0A3Q3AVM1_KRYMA|nr:homeobox protein vent1-like [Kryptolebias marmoratus]
MKYFSVDWMAQSHHQVNAAAHAHRPHVPCVVQPRAPTFGKSYLQPKPKPSKSLHQPEDRRDREDRRDQEDRMDRGDSLSSSCSSPFSEVSGDSSGYESEAASSECLSEETVDEGSEDKDGRQRRARTKFSPEQISRLEKIFSKHRYLDAGERVKTSQRLGLTETQVRTWFQNRRMKLKREVQDYLAPQIPSVRLQPLHPVRYQYPSSSTGRNPYPLPGVPQLLLQPQILPHFPLQLLIQHPQFC